MEPDLLRLDGLRQPQGALRHGAGYAVHELWFQVLTGTAAYHLYFLLVSMQIYLVFGLLLWLVRRTEGHHGRLLAAVAAYQLLLFWLLHDVIPSWRGAPHWLGVLDGYAQQLLPSYLVYVIAGALVAVHIERAQAWVLRHGRLVVLAVVVGALLTEAVYLWQVGTGTRPSRASDVLQPVMVGWTLILTTGLLAVGLRYALRADVGPAAALGARGARISFGVFLVHVLVIDLLLLSPLGPVISRPGQPWLSVLLWLGTVVVSVVFAESLPDAAVAAAHRTPLRAPPPRPGREPVVTDAAAAVAPLRGARGPPARPCGTGCAGACWGCSASSTRSRTSTGSTSLPPRPTSSRSSGCPTPSSAGPLGVLAALRALQIFGGWLGDRFGAARCLARGDVGRRHRRDRPRGGLASLVAARLLLGLRRGRGLPDRDPGDVAWLPEQLPGVRPGHRARGLPAGQRGGPAVVGGLIVLGGWRLSFYGSACCRWSGRWCGCGSTGTCRRDHPAVDGDRSSTELRRGAAPARRTGDALARHDQRLAPVTFVDFCYGWLLWVYLTWMPSLFKDSSASSSGSSRSSPAWSCSRGVAGDLVGGRLSDELLRRTGPVVARRLPLVLGLTASLVCLVTGAPGPLALATTISLALAFFFSSSTNSTIWALPMDVAPDHAGAASGLVNTGFGIAGVISPSVVGIILDRNGDDWRAPMLLSVVILGIGAVCALRVDPRRRVTSTPAEA